MTLKLVLEPTRLFCPWNSQAIILEQVALPFSRGSSWSRDQIQIFFIAGRFFTIWANRESPWSKKEVSSDSTNVFLLGSNLICFHDGFQGHIFIAIYEFLKAKDMSNGLVQKTEGVLVPIYFWENNIKRFSSTWNVSIYILLKE